MMTRIDILQHLINNYGYTKYLEIGVQAGTCFKRIQAEHKIGVDPDHNSAANVFQTSDDFFADNETQFDIIFIDGLHHADQVYKDIKNALKCISPTGMIMCHDMVPVSFKSQTIPLADHTAWMGNCWEAWVQLRQEFTDEGHMIVINTDCGCGLINPQGTNVPLVIPEDIEVNYENFEKNKVEWLNLIHPSQVVF